MRGADVSPGKPVSERRLQTPAQDAAGGPLVYDGYWFPRSVRARVLTERTRWQTLWSRAGRDVDDPRLTGGAPGDVVGARFPILGVDGFERLLDALSLAAERGPRGEALWRRLQTALGRVAAAMGASHGPIDAGSLSALASYTGYSPEMIGLTVGSPALWSIGDIAAAARFDPTWTAAREWGVFPGLRGRVRFFPSVKRARSKVGDDLFGKPEPPRVVVGYGAGNVPGTALMITLLALAAASGCEHAPGAASAAPVVVVRNSRREPLFGPLVLAALEQVDPEVVGGVAVLVWDYLDDEVQRWLLSRADLVVAAAGDAAVEAIGERVREASAQVSRSIRYHAHGHKVSFAAVAREVLEGPPRAAAAEGERLALSDIALLAALDSVVWDQNGCLSARLHFVERPVDDASGNGPLQYAAALTEQLRLLATCVPRGAWPRSLLHDAFDAYAAQTASGMVRVLSAYDDDFVVVLDERPPEQERRRRGTRVARGEDAMALARALGACTSRVVVVRPVDDLLDVPRYYLGLLPAGRLQSLSVAAGTPGEIEPSARLLRFAEECGARGVTAVRPLGRGAFPGLAYSWDGLLPRDLIARRPAGHFTTIECDAPYAEMVETCRTVRRWLSSTRP